MNYDHNDIGVACCVVGNKQVAVTGPNGYIASQFLRGKDFSLEKLAMVKPDVVLHLAARMENKLKSFEDNLSLDLAVALACNERDIKLIYSSGNNVYPLQEECEESNQVHGNDYYSFSKIAGEIIIRRGHWSSLEYGILRIGDVFGLGQRHGNLFKAISKNIMSGSALQLCGQGFKKRNYIYIKELVSILEFYLDNFDRLKNKVYNICYTNPTTVRKLLEKISELTSLPIEHVEYQDKKDIRTMRNGRLRDTGYKFRYTMDSALTDYVEAVRSQ